MVGPGGSCGAYASFGGDPNALCTALRLRKQWLLTAYCTGHVRLYDVLSKSLVVQVLPSVVSSESTRGVCPPYYSPTSYLRITCYYHDDDDHHHHHTPPPPPHTTLLSDVSACGIAVWHEFRPLCVLR